MEMWEEEFGALRQQYLRNSGERLRLLHDLLAPLAAEPGDRNGLASLMHRFHQLAGSGGTYGLPVVSALAGEGERLCTDLLASNRAPGPAEFARLGELITALAAEFSAGDDAGAGPAEPRQSDAERSASALVVDDDRDLARLIGRALEGHGFAVRFAGTRAEAERAFDEQLPHVAVVDVRLPDGTGYEVVERLRATAGGAGPVVAVVSRLAGLLDKVEAIRCGADAYVEKPIDVEALVHKLETLLEARAGGPRRVLVVEDDPDQAAVVEATLALAGFAVKVCADPLEFDATLAAFEPELVVLDVNLPDVSGFDLARYLRQQDAYAALPIIFLTTRQGIEAEVEGLEAGADDFLTKPVSPAVLVTSVTARVKRARELKALMDHDGLTRLLTRAAFLERAGAAVADGRRRPERRHALVLLDVDGFKLINDTFGHDAGDRALTALAGLLRRRLRPADVVGRLGGDEFAVLVEDLAEEDVVRLVSRLLDEYRASVHRAARGEFSTTLSGGVAMLGSADLAEWLRAADVALYEAKHAGRGCVMTAHAARSAR